MEILRLIRPGHWVKNVFVFAALIFSRKLTGPADEVFLAVAASLAAFWCFCLASSAVYAFNDIIDRKSDRLHPEKRNRPVAAGTVTVPWAAALAVMLALAAVFSAFMLARNFGTIISGYLVMMVLYSLFLKQALILDVIVIATGFSLRAVAGSVVVGAFISPWLIICTFALCLFLGFSKRQSEILELGDDSSEFRKTLAGYTPALLAHMLDVSSGLAVMCFLLYAMDQRTLRIFGTNNLVYTTPFVLYCVFRFSALIQQGKYSDPVRLVLHDRPFQVGVLLWLAAVVAIIYGQRMGISVTGLWSF